MFQLNFWFLPKFLQCPEQFWLTGIYVLMKQDLINTFFHLVCTNDRNGQAHDLKTVIYVIYLFWFQAFHEAINCFQITQHEASSYTDGQEFLTDSDTFFP